MKRIAPRRGIIRLALFLSLPISSVAFAATTFNVTINTAVIGGTKGKLVFDFITNNPGRPGNHVQILNFAAAGTLGLPETLGGLVTGDIILGANPAPFTVMDSDFFFNEVTVNFISFGNSITFKLQLPEVTPPAGAIPDQFALFLLDPTDQPLFPTSDPLGANALFAVDITGTPGGVLSVFAPTVFTPPNTLQITAPSLDTTPPLITVSADPSTLWPPNHKMVPVTVSGKITDDEPGGSGVDPSTPAFAVTDKLGLVQPSGKMSLASDGSYSFTISLQASRPGDDKDGRTYTIVVSAKDNAGNLGSASTVVTVPHDQGH